MVDEQVIIFQHSAWAYNGGGPLSCFRGRTKAFPLPAVNSHKYLMYEWLTYVDCSRHIKQWSKTIDNLKNSFRRVYMYITSTQWIILLQSSRAALEHGHVVACRCCVFRYGWSYFVRSYLVPMTRIAFFHTPNQDILGLCKACILEVSPWWGPAAPSCGA